MQLGQFLKILESFLDHIFIHKGVIGGIQNFLVPLVGHSASINKSGDHETQGGPRDLLVHFNKLVGGLKSVLEVCIVKYIRRGKTHGTELIAFLQHHMEQIHRKDELSLARVHKGAANRLFGPVGVGLIQSQKGILDSGGGLVGDFNGFQ